jgi:hypothetical protein
MTLPNFLGIGAMRCGTSWAYEQLRGHRDVYMSEQKELNFFNDFYHYGIDWYATRFPSADAAAKYKAIGEITPTYMADADVPARIHAHIPDARFIVILRNPVDRANSEYTKRLRDFNFKGTFDDFVRRTDGVLARGCYAKQLESYFRVFSRDKFLILVFEDALSKPQEALERIAKFLEIAPHGFDLNRMEKKINPSYLPRMPLLYASYVKTRQYLVRRNCGRVLTAAKKLGLLHAGRYIVRWGGPRAELPRMDEKTRKQLNEFYLPEIRTLEDLIGEDLSIWSNSTRAAVPNQHP